MSDSDLNQHGISSPIMPSIKMVSDQACLLSFGQAINETTSNFIVQVSQHLKPLTSVVDLIPSYTTLLVVFDSDYCDRFAICKAIRQTIATINPNDFTLNDVREVVIPVYYGQEVGPDLEEVIQHCQLSAEDIIKYHSETLYRAYAIGFTPGFAFLGNTPDQLHIPRKTTPRLKVPTGSVAIAENQTAVYPSPTPGGWRIIGRTPVPLVDWGSENLALIAMGDSVRFEPISRDEFLVLGGQLDGF